MTHFHSPKGPSAFNTLIRSVLRLAAAAWFFVALAVPAGAQSWKGTVNTNWSVALNWSAAPANDGTADLVFGATGAKNFKTFADLHSWNIRSITFNNVTNAVGLSGTNLTIQSGGIRNFVAKNHSISNAITLGAAQTWNASSGSLNFYGTINKAGKALTISGANNVNIYGVMSGAGGITKNGSGNLVVARSGTFSGTVSINAGSVIPAAADAMGTASITLNSGGTLALKTGNGVNNAGTLTFNGGTLVTESWSDHFGDLAIAADSTLILGNLHGQLTFSSGSWTGGILKIVNWNGASGSAGRNDRIFMTTAPGAAFLSAVHFQGYNPGATIVSGELVPAAGGPTSSPGSGTNTWEGETLTGTFSLTSDATATGSNCVEVLSPLSITNGMSPGGYLFAVRMRGTNVRGRLTYDGQRIGEFALTNNAWTTNQFPVFIGSGSDTIGIEAESPNGGGAPGPLFLDWIRLTGSTNGFTTRGTRILDPSGYTFIPRGANLAGYEGTDYLDAESFQSPDPTFLWMHNWGASVVRFTISETYWLDTCGSDDTFSDNYKEYLDAAIATANAHGLFVIFDLHHNPVTGYDCDEGQQIMADYRATNFWTQVATRYKGNTNIAFELYNEPHDILPAVWRDGGSALNTQAVHQVTYTVAGMQQMYDAVRAAGAQNLILIGGTSWANGIQVAEGNWVDGYNIVYSPHHYAVLGDPEDPYMGDHMQDWQCNNWLNVAADYPIVVTEFGSHLDNGNWYADNINFAERHGLGWLAHQWNKHWITTDGGEMGVVNTYADYAPSPRGFAVRDGLWAAAGWTSWGGVAADTVVPAAITNLTVTVTNGNALLTWTTPGDDGWTGTASFFSVRWSDIPIIDKNWTNGRVHALEKPLLYLPTPAAPGTTQSALLTGIDVTKRLFFNVRTGDDQSTESYRLSGVSGWAPLNNGARNSITYGGEELVGEFYWVQDTGNAITDTPNTNDFWCVQIPGLVENVAAVDNGTYTISAQVRGNNVRARFTCNGAPISDDLLVTANWRSISATISVTNRVDMIGIEPRPPLAGNQSPLFLNTLTIAP